MIIITTIITIITTKEEEIEEEDWSLSNIVPQSPDRRPLVCHRYNLVDVLSVQLQHKIIRNPLPRVLPRDRIANSLRLPPSLRILDANPDLLPCLAVDQQASADNRVDLSAFHQTIFHGLLVFVRNLQHNVIQWNHGKRDVATEARHACRAAYNNMRLSGSAAASQLGESLEDGGHAFPANLPVVYRHFGEDEFTADGGDDFIDKLPFLGHQALRDGSDIVRITLDDLKVWGCLGREDGRKLGWDTTEGDASVPCGEGVLECREPHTGTGTEKCNGLAVSGHCGGWSMVLWRCRDRIAM